MGAGGHGLWRNRAFRRLWASETISQTGTRVSMLALPLVAALVLDASPLQMGILAGLVNLPALVVGLFAGVFVDRWRRRWVLVVADLGRALLLGLVPVAWALDLLRIELLFAVTLLTGTFSVFYAVAYRSYLPELVPREQLVEGNSKLEISRSAAEIGGPGLAGVLVQLIGAPLAVITDAISFLASAALIGSIRSTERDREPVERRAGLLREAAEGLRLVLGDQLLRSIAGAAATATIFSTMLEAVFILYLTRALDLRPVTIGIVFAAGSVGFLVGALLPERLTRRFGLGPTLAASLALVGLGDLLISLATGPRLVVIGVLIVAEFIFGIGLTVFSINQVSLRQAVTPERLQGRMNATMLVLVSGATPLAALLGGIAGELLGLRATLLLAAIGELAAVGWIALSPTRQLRTHPESIA
ncbi:MAG TPA: MFS transporter [Thermomicrobiales bacterium]|nr:MFS transporter [Thermomicrobiales bacterium]